MSLIQITNAIQAHKAWIASFQTALDGKISGQFDCLKIRSDTECEFGQWIHGNSEGCFKFNSTKETAIMIHRMFHDIAGDITEQLNRNSDKVSIQHYIDELQNVSDQLVHLLTHEKSKLLESS